MLAPGRITGLAGATTATAQSLEGVYNNTAAPAVREPHSVDRFEWEPTAGISFPGAYGGTDFNNRGDKGIEQQIERNKRLGVARRSTVETTDNFLYLNGGLWGQLGNLGVTVTADMLRYDVAAQTSDQPSLAVGLTRIHAAVAYGFLDNQLCVGMGLRLAYVDLSELGREDTAAISMFGLGPQAGLIVKPEERPWRVGVTARAPVSASSFSLSNVIREEQPDSTVVRRAGASFIVPGRIVQPWEVEAGVAYQLGPRPLNPPWRPPGHPSAGSREVRRARYLNWPREHVLLLASVLMTGASTEAVALEGFIDQRREIVGSRVTVSPRFAVEGEPIANRLKSRAGIYVEPSRFRDGTARQHLTLGVDVRLFHWDVFGILGEEHQWRASAFLDVAERYQNFGIGVGTWH